MLKGRAERGQKIRVLKLIECEHDEWEDNLELDEPLVSNPTAAEQRLREYLQEYVECTSR